MRMILRRILQDITITHSLIDCWGVWWGNVSLLSWHSQYMLIRVPRSSLQKISHNSVQEILLQKISHKFSLFCSHVLLSPWWHTGKDQSFIFPPERWLCFMEKSQNTPWIINDWFHISKHCCLFTYIKSTSSFFHFSASLSAQTVLLACGGSGNHYQTVGATYTTHKTV